MKSSLKTRKSQLHITNKTVDRESKPEIKPYELWDNELQGFILRVQPSGVKTFYLEYARKKRVKIGPADSMTPEQARMKALALKSAFKVDGVIPETGKAKRQREQKEELAKALEQANSYLNFLSDKYRKHLVQTLRSGVDNAENVKETMDNLIRRFPEFHQLRLNEISLLEIDKWKQRRADEGVRTSTIQRQLNDLRACLNMAVEWELLANSPFARSTRRNRKSKIDSNAVVRFLSTDEEISLRSALDKREAKIRAGRESANEWRSKRNYVTYSDMEDQFFADHLKPAVLLSLNTGLRRGELLKLKWKNVDFERKMVTVEGETAKSNKTRHVPLNEEALLILQEWKRQPGVKSSYVFCDAEGKPFRDMRTSWETVIKLAKISNFRWHDLRHTFASKLAIAGVDLNKVRALLGHSDYKMTLRYAHLAPEHLHEAVAMLTPVSYSAAPANDSSAAT